MSDWTGSGTIISGSGGTFTAPGMTVGAIESRVAKIVGLDTGDSDSLAAIDEAITLAGQIATMWEGRAWWWAANGKGTFPTVDGTGSYALRTVNAADMADMYAPTRVFVGDEYKLRPMAYEDYEDWVVGDFSEGKPLNYALAGDITMYLSPVPDAVYTITCLYLKRHSKISSGSGLLTVPAEWHRPVYCDGAAFLIKNDLDANALKNSEAFVRAMRGMAAAEPRYYDNAISGGGDFDARAHFSSNVTI